MNSKNATNVIRQFQKVASQYAQLEAMPIMINEQHMISTREIHTLDAIGDKRLNMVSDVGRHFGVTKSAASQLVSKLEAKGFLLKSSSAKNNKELQLVLTELGWEAYRVHEQLHGKERAALMAQLEQFPAEQLITFKEMLGLFSKVISQQFKQK
ncbi:MAG: MarR family transcriptional regulator [Colwellia sp.]